MSVNVIGVSDVSTLASDFQADGTADAGSTGRVADAGHVHPAPALDYQVVSVDFSKTIGNVQSNGIMSITVSAPTGYKVVGGGYFLSADDTIGWLDNGPWVNGPASDGSSWTVAGEIRVPTGNTDTSTAYAICVAA